MVSSQQLDFGGAWSMIKLDALKEYMQLYTTALKNQPFNEIYIDAFAGAGQHPESRQDELFNEPIADPNNAKRHRHGSPIIALENKPPFDHFIFIEKNLSCLESLKKQIKEKGLDKKNIDYVHGDANEKLPGICKKIVRGSNRGFIFLDPCSLEVAWDTLVAINQTKADMWFLFPYMAVNRILPRKGEVSLGNRKKLDRLWGDTSWYREIYKPSATGDMFKPEQQTWEKRRENIIQKVTTRRLENLFPAVHKKPLELRNSQNSLLFLLYFVCANPSKKAHSLARRLANHIITSVTRSQ